jgi:folate-binding protein YgfZ
LRPSGELAIVSVVSAADHHVRLATLPHQARSWVRVSGDDAARFLQGLLSADVAEIEPGVLVPATLLTVKGKIVSEVWVFADAHDDRLLALPSETVDEVVAHFDAHIIMDDVELERLEFDCAIVWRDGGLLRRADLQALPRELAAADATHPLAGVLVYGPAASVTAWVGALGQPADHDGFTAARVAQGRPAWGFELLPDHFPPEVGFVDAVSYEKGCYLGQEPLSRIHNRGQVNRVLVRVRASAQPDGVLPIPLADAKGTEVGRLTSFTSTFDGLAVVKRAAAVPGTELVGGAAHFEVRSAALGDDPGGPGRRSGGTVKLGGR